MKKKSCCARCGKREGLGRNHERISFEDGPFHLCVECAQLIYRAKDAVSERNLPLAQEYIREFSAFPFKESEILRKWLKVYTEKWGIPITTELDNKQPPSSNI